MNLKKTIAYPADKISAPYISYISDTFNEIKLESIMSYSGSGLIGRELSYYANSKGNNMIVESVDFNKIEESDLILFFNSNALDVIEETIRIAEHAVKNNVEVIFLMDILNKNHFNDFAQKYIGKYACFGDKKSRKILENNPQNHCMSVPNIPVVFIGGLVDDANQVEIALKITNKLKTLGYHSTFVGINEALNFLDGYSYDFILDMQCSDGTKIKNLNKLFNAIVKRDRSEILIVQIPGNMFKYNNRVTGDFGMKFHMLSQALMPDYFICCLMHGEYSQMLLDALINESNEKFGYKIDVFHLSNTFVDTQYEPIDNEMSLIKLPFHNKNYFCSDDIIAANILESDDNFDLAVKRIIKLLN